MGIDLNSFLNVDKKAVIIASVAIGIVVLATYLFSHYLLMRTGRNRGVKNSWMAFVPFACDFYRVRITEWKKISALVIGWFPVTVAASFTVAAMVIGNSTVKLILFIFAGLVSLGGLVFATLWKVNFYKAFGFSGAYAAAAFIPPFNVASVVADVRIALDFGLNDPITEKKAPEEAAPVVDLGVQQVKSASVRFICGALAGRSIVINGTKAYTVGRAPDCDIVVPASEEHISRVHCTIAFDSVCGRYVVTDRSSAGTYIGNDMRLESNKPTQIPRGASIYLATKENTLILE